MSKDVHAIIMTQFEQVVNRAGFWSKKELEENHRIKSRRTHGFDLSKFNAASLFYMPCQAKDPKDSFFIDHNEPHRGPLDVHQWVNRCIVDLRPEPEPEIQAKIDVEAAPPAAGSPGLVALRDKLLAEKATHPAGYRQTMVAEAVEAWRTTARGDGHAAFYRLGAALQRAGLDDGEIRQMLRDEAIYANSPRERRGEIKGILNSLQRRGTFGRAA
jgi:hypothetical protein